MGKINEAADVASTQYCIPEWVDLSKARVEYEFLGTGESSVRYRGPVRGFICDELRHGLVYEGDPGEAGVLGLVCSQLRVQSIRD